MEKLSFMKRNVSMLQEGKGADDMEKSQLLTEETCRQQGPPGQAQDNARKMGHLRSRSQRKNN